jgi:hypothetical protein
MLVVKGSHNIKWKAKKRLRAICSRDPNFLAFNLEPERIGKILGEYYANCFGYCDYLRYPGYGISLSSSEWVTFQVNAVGLEQ